MSAPDLRLVEVCDPPIIGNTLHVEEYVGGEQAVFLCMCGSDEDPVKKGYSMELKRHAVVQLRDWLNTVLAASNQ
jgi:hypothetical protein